MVCAIGQRVAPRGRRRYGGPPAGPLVLRSGRGITGTGRFALDPGARGTGALIDRAGEPHAW